jgi:hypothetical protein
MDLHRPDLALATAMLCAVAAADATATLCPRHAKMSFYSDASGEVLYYPDVRPRQAMVVVGADVASFESLSTGSCDHGSYARDARSVFYEGVKIPAADVHSFEVIGDIYTGIRARDKVYGFEDGKPVCAWTKAAPGNLPACDPGQYRRR